MIKGLVFLNNLVQLKILNKPLPFSGVFWVTDECNCRCKMCSIWNKEPKRELELAIFARQFSQSRLLRNLTMVVFSGGEPFLKEDIADFVDVVNRYSAALNISFGTNGFFTTRIISVLEKILSKKGIPINIKLSLDGIGKVHDAVRGIAGSFNKSIETLVQLCRLRDGYPGRLSISLGFTGTTINYEQMPQLIELAKKSRIGFFYKPVMYAEGLYNEDIDKELFLSREQLNFLAARHRDIIANMNKGGFAKNYLYKNYLNFLERYYKKPARYFSCSACSASFHVGSDWNVFSCLKCAYVIGNLKESGFDEIFNSKDAAGIREKIKKSSCHCLCTGEIFPSMIIHKFPIFV